MNYTSAGGQLLYVDRYFSFASMAYSTAKDIGAIDVNRYRTEYGYDGRGRMSKVKNEAGTSGRWWPTRCGATSTASDSS